MKSSAKVSWIALLATIVAVPSVVGTIPFGPQFMLNPFSSPPIAVLGLGVTVAFGAWLVALMRGEVELRGHAVLLALAGLIALLALSTALSLDKLYALFGDGDDLNGLAVYVLCALAAFLVVQLATGRKALTQLTTAVIASGLVVASVALVQQLFVVDIFGEVVGEQRSTLLWMISQGASTLGNPDFTGTFLVVPAVLALGRALRPAKTTRDQLVSALPALVACASLALTLTRGAWIALFSGAVVLAVLVVRHAGFTAQLKRVAIGLGVAALAVTAFAWPEVARRVGELLGSGTTGVSGRTLIWSETLAMIAKRPLTGTGPAAFRLGWYGVREPLGLIVGAGATATDAHNYPLMLAAVGGIPAAVVAFGAWLYALLRSAKTVWKTTTPFGDYSAWWAAALGLSVGLMTGVATTPVLLLVFVTLAVLVTPYAGPSRVNATAGRALAAGLAVLGACAMVVTLMQAQVHVAARSALRQTPEALAAVAQRAAFNGQFAVLAAQFTSDAVVQSGAEATAIETGVAQIISPIAAAHPADYEPLQLWSTQLFVAGDISGSNELLEAALEVSDKALELYPSSLSVRTNRARALVTLGRAGEARAELDGYVGKDPTFKQDSDVWALIQAAEASATPAP